MREVICWVLTQETPELWCRLG